MLCDEYRMIAPGRLFPVICRGGLRQPLLDEYSRVIEDLSHAFASQIIQFLALEAKPAAKRRLTQTAQDFLHISHGETTNPRSSGKLVQKGFGLPQVSRGEAFSHFCVGGAQERSSVFGLALIAP